MEKLLLLLYVACCHQIRLGTGDAGYQDVADLDRCLRLDCFDDGQDFLDVIFFFGKEEIAFFRPSFILSLF